MNPEHQTALEAVGELQAASVKMLELGGKIENPAIGEALKSIAGVLAVHAVGVMALLRSPSDD